MADPFWILSERIKDEAGGVSRKVGILDAWLKFQRDGGYPILPTHPFIVESLRNAHELAALKMFHLLEANQPDDASLLRFQDALERRVAPADVERSEVTRLGRKLKQLRKAHLPKLQDYRHRKVAHPTVELPSSLALDVLRAAASDVFVLVEGYQTFMHGGLNYEAESEAYRDSFLVILHSVSVETARQALGVNFTAK